MSDLVSFLTARIDEDEAVAKKAAGLVGVGAASRRYTAWSYDREQFRVTTDGTSWINAKDTGDACGEHIARHDPARVLAEIAAKRAIIQDYLLVTANNAIERASGGDEVAALARDLIVKSLRMALRRLASVWSEHPDYDPAWKLDGKANAPG